MGRRSGSDDWGAAAAGRDIDGIEFLAPDPGAFGHGAGVDASVAFDAGAAWADDPARPRSTWAAVGAVGVVTAFVVAAVAIAAPWNDDPTTAPTTTVTATTAQSTADGSGPEPTGPAPSTGLLLDPPEGWTLAGALTGGPTADFSGWGEVWAEPTASRTDGRWYALSLVPYSLDGAAVPGAVRVAVDNRIALVEHAADGVLTLTVDAPYERRPRLMRIEASGTTVDDLVAFAASIGIEDDRPQLVDDRFVFRDQAFVDGLSQVWSGPSDWDPIRTAAVGYLHTFASYQGDSGEWLWLGVGDNADAPQGFSTLQFLTLPVELPALPSAISNVQVGRTPQRSHALFQFDDMVVNIVTTLDEQQLAAILPTVRRASADEWTLARLTANSGPARPPWGRMTTVEQTLTSDASADSRASWTLSVEPQGRYAEIDVVGPSGRSSSIIELFPDVDDPVGIVSTIDTTVVVARRPGPHTLSVTTVDGVTRELAFTDTGAVQVDALGPVQVELRDATGQVVHSE